MKAKTKLLLLIPVLLLLAFGCTKKHDSTPVVNNNNNNNNNAKPYYFRFTLNGLNDTISGDSTIKAYTENTNGILADVSSNAMTLYPDISLRFSLPEFYDTMTEANVLGLAGKTIYFSDTVMAPELEYQATDTSLTWYSQPVSDTSYNVKVSGVTFLSAAVYQGHPVRTYAITGTCRALVHQTPAADVALAGSFKLILVRVNYK